MTPSLPTRRIGTCTIVELPEEIDLANGDDIENQMHSLVAGDTASLIIDVGTTIFFPTRAIAIVVMAHTLARQLGKWVGLVNLSHETRRVLQIAGLDLLIPIYKDVGEALTMHAHNDPDRTFGLGVVPDEPEAPLV